MNGIICVYKPIGFTSFDVIAIMRKLLNTKKIGHSGTLDPMAEGVLPVFVGAATKAVDFTPDTDKEYRAVFKLGFTTDTQDITGNVVEQAQNCFFVPRSRIERIMRKFVGEIEQIPPMYSAVKVGGKRLYQMARKGIEVERQSRKITINSIALESYDADEYAGVIRVHCSKGTYVRTLIHDIGYELGFGAVMTALQRSMSNGFTLDDCHTLDVIRNVHARNPDNLQQLLKPIDSLFTEYPKAYLDEQQTRLYHNGVVLNADLVRMDKVHDGLYSLYDCNGRMAALAKIKRDHSISIEQRFNYHDRQPKQDNESEQPDE
jgi:tRNA pseudouridine55 synthase